MKYAIKLLSAGSGILRACLLVSALILSVRVYSNQYCRLPARDKQFIVASFTNNTKAPGKHLPLSLKAVSNHKPGCSRTIQGKSLSGDLASERLSYENYFRPFSGYLLYPMSWARPRYYIFLFIYTLF